MRKMILSAAAAAAFLGAPAYADIVDFSELAHDPDVWGIMAIASPYISGGLLFTSDSGFMAYDRGREYNADPLGTTLAAATITITRADGGLFDLASLQLAGGWNSNRDVGPIGFTFTDGAGVVTSSTYTLTRGLGLRTYTANRTGIASVTIDGVGIHGGAVENLIQIDNINWTPLASAQAVPEPATWAMMIGGLGLAGAALRRRRALSPAGRSAA